MLTTIAIIYVTCLILVFPIAFVTDTLVMGPELTPINRFTRLKDAWKNTEIFNDTIESFQVGKPREIFLYWFVLGPFTLLISIFALFWELCKPHKYIKVPYVIKESLAYPYKVTKKGITLWAQKLEINLINLNYVRLIGNKGYLERDINIFWILEACIEYYPAPNIVAFWNKLVRVPLDEMIGLYYTNRVEIVERMPGNLRMHFSNMLRSTKTREGAKISGTLDYYLHYVQQIIIDYPDAMHWNHPYLKIKYALINEKTKVIQKIEAAYEKEEHKGNN